MEAVVALVVPTDAERGRVRYAERNSRTLSSNGEMHLTQSALPNEK